MKILSCLILATALCTGSLYAQKPDHAGKGKKEKKQKKHKKQNKKFSSADTSTVNSYYRNLPQGLQKKMQRTGELPPGWSKKVSLGKPVPKEYIDVAKPVSNDLKVKLHLGSNEQLLQISNKLLKVEIGTNILLDEIDFW